MKRTSLVSSSSPAGDSPGPGNCQEARQQAGGLVRKRVASKPSVKGPSRGSN